MTAVDQHHRAPVHFPDGLLRLAASARRPGAGPPRRRAGDRAVPLRQRADRGAGAVRDPCAAPGPSGPSDEAGPGRELGAAGLDSDPGYPRRLVGRSPGGPGPDHGHRGAPEPAAGAPGGAPSRSLSHRAGAGRPGEGGRLLARRQCASAAGHRHPPRTEPALRPLWTLLPAARSPGCESGAAEEPRARRTPTSFATASAR